MPIQQQKHTSTVPHVVSSGSTTSLSNTRSHRSNSSSSRSNSSSITHMPATFTPSESIFTSGFGSTQSFLSLSDPLDSLADIPVMESFQPNPVNVMSNNLYNQQQYQQQPQNPETSQPSQRSGQQSLDFHNMQMNFLTTPDVIASNISSQQHNTNMQIGSYHQSNILPVPIPAPISSPTQTSPISQHTISNEAVAQIVSNTSVPEFLYQLTKMLTDEHRDIIEWSNAKIEVHNPHRLEVEVLNKYFRHSKYASFQRQLNYFGFRKLAGKGKMAPCSYVNENATTDLRSLLRMKVRKYSCILIFYIHYVDSHFLILSFTIFRERPVRQPKNPKTNTMNLRNRRKRLSRHSTGSNLELNVIDLAIMTSLTLDLVQKLP